MFILLHFSYVKIQDHNYFFNFDVINCELLLLFLLECIFFLFSPTLNLPCQIVKKLQQKKKKKSCVPQFSLKYIRSSEILLYAECHHINLALLSLFIDIKFYSAKKIDIKFYTYYTISNKSQLQNQQLENNCKVCNEGPAPLSSTFF